MCVMDSPALQAQRAVCTVKFVKSFATWQHRFDVDLNILSCPAPLSLVQFHSKCSLISSSVGGSDHIPQISSKFVEYSCEFLKIGKLRGSDICAGKTEKLYIHYIKLGLP